MSIWKKINKHLTPVLVFLAFFICIVFTTICLVFAYKDIEVSSTLIEWVFRFFGLEMLALSGIKISKHIGSAFGKVEEVTDGNYVEEDEDEDEEIEYVEETDEVEFEEESEDE